MVALGAALFATGCTVTVTPGENGETSPTPVDQGADDRSDRIHPRLEVSPFPGATTLEREVDGDEVEMSFRVDAPIQRVYAHFHSGLASSGWRRTDIERDDDEIEASYVRRSDGEELELELEREGAGRFDLSIEFD